MSAALGVILCGLAAGLAADLPDSATIQKLFDEVAAIASLPPRERVRYEAIRREQLSGDLQRRMKKSASARDIRDEGLALQWLGLLPAGFDLRQSTVDLLTEQAAAFYDYRKRRLVLMENPIGEYDESVIAHELAHALADQYFRIGRYMEDAGRTDDAAMARMAVIEGQASWLMTEFELRRLKRGSLLEDPSLMPAWSSVDTGRQFGFPVLERAPLYLRASLLFPYWEGGRFQAAVVKRLGASGFRRVFEQPPATTQQILHPDVYWEGRAAESVALARWRGRRSRIVSGGAFGELDFLILFTLAGVRDAASLAAKWRGGVYEVRERGARCCAVRMASTWADDGAAAAAATVWERYAAGKTPRGKLIISRNGRRVDVSEGLELLQPK